MKLRFTPRATANIIEIADYIRASNPAAAERVRAAIYESLQNLLLFPHVGRRQKTEGVRKFVTRRYGYLVYYAVDEAAAEIVILNIKHPARRREHEDALMRRRSSQIHTLRHGRSWLAGHRHAPSGLSNRHIISVVQTIFRRWQEWTDSWRNTRVIFDQ